MLIPLTSDEYDTLAAAGTFMEPVLNCPQDGEPSWDSIEGTTVIFQQLRTEQALGNLEEAKFWLGIGTMASQMRNREGLFRMQGRCGFLGENNECTAYEVRPEICRAFTPGGAACKAVLNDRVTPMASVPVEIRVNSTIG